MVKFIAKICGVHDLLWDLSLRECRKEGCYIFGQSNVTHSHLNDTMDDMNYLMGLTSTFLCFEHSFETNLPPSYTCFRLLKVLDIQSESFPHFPDEITDLADLRYLELSSHGNIPGSVSKLCNLETLINNYTRSSPVLPKEIWLLRHLRHLQLGIFTFLPDCSSILPHLWTLTTLSFTSCTKQVFTSIPNLKRLRIYGINGQEDEKLFNFLNYLIYLHQLEQLNLHFSKGVRGQLKIPWCDLFSPSIKHLTLSGSHLPWEDMDILAMLPNLEVLKLKNNAFQGPVYHQTVVGFPRLKVLQFEYLDLKYWIAETVHFPVLQQLVLRSCYFLKGIPYCFGEIPTLESIELEACSSSSKDSAKTILREQQDMGNYDLQIRICMILKEMVFKLEFYDYENKQEAKEKVSGLSGVESFSFNTKDKLLTVTGHIDPFTVVRALRKVCSADCVSVGTTKVPEKDLVRR